MVKELIRLCDELGVEYSAHLNDLINVVNHKTWDGIPHIHIGVSRIHVAIEPEAIEFIIDEYSARDCAARPLKLSIHSGGIEHACRRR